MKLFYDVLVPFIPDSNADEKGELVPDKVKVAGKNAMIDLANFQRTSDISALLHSVICVCAYQEKDLVDAILSVPNDLSIESGVKLEDLVDECAKMIFKSIKPGNDFDLNKYIVNVFTVAHTILNIAETSKEEEIKEVKEADIQEVNNESL